MNPNQKATIPAKVSYDLNEISMKNLEYTQGGSFNLRKKSKNEKKLALELTGTSVGNTNLHSHRSNQNEN